MKSVKRNFKLNEDEKLMEEKKELSNFERIFEAVQTSYNALKGEQKGLDWISLVMGDIWKTAAELNPEYKDI